jgi:dihydrofolate synthase / folylpolyglutamate synthase
VNFNESETYLLSLGNEVSAMKLGLDNIRSLLATLGNPEAKYVKVQVAGTNGKGSVCAFLDAICQSAGISVGVFTSPHLISVTERIRINGRDISEDRFAQFATIVRETAEKMLAAGTLQYRPTFFEQLTAIGLLAFADGHVALAIIETGLGGRLDATTAATAEMALITQISLDHQEYLGESIYEIAREKAAIIHAESSVVVATQHEEAEAAIEDRLKKLGSRAIWTSQVAAETGTRSMEFRSAKAAYRISELGLKGRHQIENAKVAILAAETLQRRFSITVANIVNGLENARNPGRLEFDGKYLFDGAHNAAGASALRAYLDESVHVPLTIVFGAMKGKNIREIGEMLFPKADKLILTRPVNSRSLRPEDLRPTALLYRSPEMLMLTNSVPEALTAAENVTPTGGIILITGSLYLIGEAKKEIQGEFAKDTLTIKIIVCTNWY